MQEILSELYGVICQPKKPMAGDPSDPDYQTDITCTFGGFTKDSGLREENDKKIENTEVDDFLDVNHGNHSSVYSEKILLSSTNQAANKRAGRDKAALSKSGDCVGKTHDRDPSERPLLVRQRENECKKSHFSVDRTTCNFTDLKTSAKKTSEKDENQGKSNDVYSSTQKSLDAYFPSIPESSIFPDDDGDFLSVSDSSVVKGSDNNVAVSGIAPLPLSHVSLLPEVDGTENNQNIEKKGQGTFSAVNLDTSKLHESFTGSDGIPVYKIPAIPPMDNTDTDSENNSSVRNIQAKDGNPIKESSSEKVPFPDTELGDVQLSKPEHLKEREENNAGSWSRGMPINGKDIQVCMQRVLKI